MRGTPHNGTIEAMSTEQVPSRLRASDTEREHVASIVARAGTEGRLTMAELDERLGAVYATRYTDELTALTADLPAPAAHRPVRKTAHPALRVHAAIVVAVSVLLVLRWVASDVPYFWPIAPMFWLTVSLIMHARVRMGRARRRARTPLPFTG